ncbi:MAG: VWA domain-containing protein [Bacteroidia bacterium]|nr:VWA domain-containing protein [Bacteroidia bacterium]
MKRWATVEGAFSEWLGASEFLNPADRRFLAELLFMHLYDVSYPSIQELKDSGIEARFPNWASIILSVLEENRLRKATKNHEEFALSVAKETLRWCMKMNLRFLAHHDFQGEESHFRHVREHLHDLPSSMFLQRVESLSANYPEKANQWRFYKRAFEEEQYNGSGTISPDHAVLRENFLEDWDQELHSAKTATEQTFLSGKWGDYIGDLSEKAERLEEMEDIIEPFSQFLGQAWNSSLGNWREINWSQLKAISAQMKTDPQLRDLMVWLGRWQSNMQDKELQRRSDPLPKNNWQPNPLGKSEIIGIHQSDRIESVIPSEIALLSTPETEIIFSQKYVEHKLLTFQYRSLDVEREEDPKQQIMEPSASETNGPFILCIDTSGSMYGTPEQIAKGLALAITELAMRENRACYLISFSTGVRALELTGMEKSVESLIAFLKMSFHGSTDMQPALQEATRLLREQRYQKADVMVISDFLIPRVERELRLEIKRMKQEQGTRFHSMFIGRNPDSNHVPLAIFDHHWIYDLNHPGVMRQWISYMRILEGHQA